MKHCFSYLSYKTLLLVLVTLVQACGNSEEDITYQINSETQAISFVGSSSEISMPSQPLAVTFNGEDLLLGFAPNTEPVSWLNFRTENLTSTSATIHFNIPEEATFPPGVLEATVRVSSGSIDKSEFAHLDIKVTLSIWDKRTVSFLGKRGTTEIDSKAVSVFFSSPWTATTDVDWLELDNTSGSEPATITLSALVNGNEEVGLSQGSIVITETATAQEITIPVELAIDNPRLIVEQQALTFSKTPAFEQTDINLAVRVSNNESTVWQGTSDSEWLSLISNNDSNVLSIHADASNLTTGLYEGNITVAASDASSNVTSTKVAITFYVSDINSMPQVINDIRINPNASVLSPTKPYIYIGQGSTIKTINILTGEIVNVTESPLTGVDIAAFAIHPNGSVLLCSAIETYTDQDNNEQRRVNHYQLDLNNYQLTEFAHDDVVIKGRPIGIEMIDGAAMVLTNAMEFSTLDLTKRYRDLDSAFAINTYAKAANTSTLSFFNQQNLSVESYKFEYNALSNQPFNYVYQHSYATPSFEDGLYSLAYSADGQHLYSANTSTELSSLINGQLIDQGVIEKAPDAQAFEVTVDYKSNSFFYRFMPTHGFMIKKYNALQQLLYAEVITTELGQPSISAPYQVAVIYSEENATLSMLPFTGN